MGRAWPSVQSPLALSIVKFRDPVGTPEAVARIGFAVATANRLKTFAVFARDAEFRNSHARAGLGARLRAHLGRAFSGSGFAPQTLVAGGPGDAAARLPGGYRVSPVVRHRDDRHHRDAAQSEGQSR